MSDTSDSSSYAADPNIDLYEEHAENGHRKRRKLSPDNDQGYNGEESSVLPTHTESRIKAKKIGLPNASGLHPVQAANTIKEKTTFAGLEVSPWLVMSLAAMAIKRPTGIQKGCIPEILKGRDCIGGSRTGSGKTVAFAVPILQKWSEDPVGIFAVVLTPTR